MSQISSYAYGEDTPEARHAMYGEAFRLLAKEEGEEIPDEPPWHTRWSGGRDCSFGYDDEYLPGDSWTYKKIVGPSFDSRSTIDLKVCIRGKRRRGRLVPQSFSATLEFRGYSLRVDTGRSLPSRSGVYYCHSVADALRRAEKLPLEELKQRLLKQVFSHKHYARNARCVYRVETNENGLIAVPWMTSLCSNPMEWPAGKYLEVGWFDDWREKRWRRIELEVNVSWHGYGSGSVTGGGKMADIAKGLECWIDEPAAR